MNTAGPQGETSESPLSRQDVYDISVASIDLINKFNVRFADSRGKALHILFSIYLSFEAIEASIDTEITIHEAKDAIMESLDERVGCLIDYQISTGVGLCILWTSLLNGKLWAFRCHALPVMEKSIGECF